MKKLVLLLLTGVGLGGAYGDGGDLYVPLPNAVPLDMTLERGYRAQEAGKKGLSYLRWKVIKDAEEGKMNFLYRRGKSENKKTALFRFRNFQNEQKQ